MDSTDTARSSCACPRLRRFARERERAHIPSLAKPPRAASTRHPHAGDKDRPKTEGTGAGAFMSCAPPALGLDEEEKESSRKKPQKGSKRGVRRSYAVVVRRVDKGEPKMDITHMAERSAACMRGSQSHSFGYSLGEAGLANVHEKSHGEEEEQTTKAGERGFVFPRNCSARVASRGWDAASKMRCLGPGTALSKAGWWVVRGWYPEGRRGEGCPTDEAPRKRKTRKGRAATRSAVRKKIIAGSEDLDRRLSVTLDRRSCRRCILYGANGRFPSRMESHLPMGLWLALHLSTIQPPDPACHIAPAARTPEVTLALAQRPQSAQAAPRATGARRMRKDKSNQDTHLQGADS
ncbi:hypothetical protein K438DRAFT_1748358 [Mycena galopus ATCC 62051]|nr:hypothetical protein K438DRAFT_1748358 [Mycena galopus ATCC 62051]